MHGGIRSAFGTLVLALAVGLTLWPLAAGAEPATSPVMEWESGDNVFAAAEELTIDRKIEGGLTAAGQIVILTRDAAVKGDTWIAGRRVAVEGAFGGDLSIRAQEALVNGHVKGDVSFYGVELVLGPDARIDGDVDYFSASSARIDKGAVVAGAVNGNAFRDVVPEKPSADTRESWRDDHMRARPGMDPRHERGLAAPGYHMSMGSAVVFGALAVLFVLVAPATVQRMRMRVEAQPGLAALFGLIWLLGVPALAVVSAITIIGLPVSLLLVLLWPLGMALGLVAALASLGSLIASRIGQAGEGALGLVTGTVLATAALWLGISVPVLGALVWLAAVTGGLGALVMALRAEVEAE